jgi:hypothetical protein
VSENSLPAEGSVLGVDVGCSSIRRSTAACRLDWNAEEVSWVIERFRAAEPERSQALRRVANRPIIAASFDGPLRSDLEVIGRYRMAEQLLTRGLGPLIGKPGQSSTPIGRLLNSHTNTCAKAILDMRVVGSAAHANPIHASAIVEAFSSSFLGVLISNPLALRVHRRIRSDTFYRHLAQSGGLLRLLQYLLPRRSPEKSFDAVVDHDERASVVCTLTALCVAAGDYTAVGNEDGWIVLPPPALIQNWAWKILTENARGEGLEWSGSFPAIVTN